MNWYSIAIFGIILNFMIVLALTPDNPAGGHYGMGIFDSVITVTKAADTCVQITSTGAVEYTSSSANTATTYTNVSALGESGGLIETVENIVIQIQNALDVTKAISSISSWFYCNTQAAARLEHYGMPKAFAGVMQMLINVAYLIGIVEVLRGIKVGANI